MQVVHMNDLQLLRDATVQDIQLELIRRHRYNLFDGQRVRLKDEADGGAELIVPPADWS